jgi:hypothetical protein
MDPQIRSTLDSAPQAFGPFDAALRENEAALAELFGDAAAVEGVLTARIPALTALFPSMEKGLKALASVERDGKLGVTLILDSKATCAYDVDKQSPTVANQKRPYIYEYCTRDGDGVQQRGPSTRRGRPAITPTARRRARPATSGRRDRAPPLTPRRPVRGR